MPAELTESMIESLQSAAQKLTGFRRRQFQAEMALKYCAGSGRRAERVFGWGRGTVDTGLNELRTGIRCLDHCSGRGRHKMEEQYPELAEEIRTLVEPHSQADPKFQTPFAYTRITAPEVHKQLTANAANSDCPVPAERSLYRILNRLGYRLRRVRKTKPQKSSPRPTPSSTTCDTSTHKPPAIPPRSASRSIRKPK